MSEFFDCFHRRERAWYLDTRTETVCRFSCRLCNTDFWAERGYWSGCAGRSTESHGTGDAGLRHGYLNVLGTAGDDARGKIGDVNTSGTIVVRGCWALA